MNKPNDQILEGISDQAKKYLWNHPGALTGLLEFALFQFKSMGDAEEAMTRLQGAISELEEGLEREGDKYEW